MSMIACLGYSCDDILEEDIQNNQIITLNPKEGDSIAGNTVQFLWEGLEGADSYRVQVYRESNLVTDTTVSTYPFTEVLIEGSYQWRIKGQNFAYETPYTFPVVFTVTPSDNLSNQTLILTSPSDNIYTNNTTIIFTWNPIPSAISYTFELIKVTGSGDITVFLEEEIQSTSLELDAVVIDSDAQYKWQVKAVNETSETNFFSRGFFIDTEAPLVPSLVSPDLDEEFEVGEDISFSWTFGADPGNVVSSVSSFYEIASDQDFQTIIISDVITPTSINLTFENSGSYYWRVRGEDEAGNIGGFDQNGKFIIGE